MKAKMSLSVPVVHRPNLNFRIWNASAAAMANAHTHQDIEVNLLLSGKMEYFLGGRFHEVRAGEVTVFWAGIPHQTLSKSANVTGIWMTFPLEWLLRWRHAVWLADRLLIGTPVNYEATAKVRDFFEQWLEGFSSGEPALREIIAGELESHFSRLSLALEKTPVGRGHAKPAEALHRVEQITRYLSEHYTDELRVDHIANFMRLHPKYLLSLFRKSCRMTLWEYVVRLRLAHAQRLLVSTERKVTDIALEAGFGSLSAFYSAFRKYVPKDTPAALRNRRR